MILFGKMKSFCATSLILVLLMLAACSKAPIGVTPPTAEQIASRERRREAQAQLKALQEAKEVGRRIENFSVSVMNESDHLRVEIQNRSLYRTTLVRIKVTNSTAWEKYLNARSRGVAVRDMPRDMRSDYLRSTGYWETYHRIRAQTHKVIAVTSDIAPGAAFVHFEPLPKDYRVGSGLRAEIIEIQDASGMPWCNDLRLQEAELFSDFGEPDTTRPLKNPCN